MSDTALKPGAAHFWAAPAGTWRDISDRGSKRGSFTSHWQRFRVGCCDGRLSKDSLRQRFDTVWSLGWLSEYHCCNDLERTVVLSNDHLDTGTEEKSKTHRSSIDGGQIQFICGSKSLFVPSSCSHRGCSMNRNSRRKCVFAPHQYYQRTHIKHGDPKCNPEISHSGSSDSLNVLMLETLDPTNVWHLWIHW